MSSRKYKQMQQRTPPSILDPAFKYYSSVNTDIRRTFERVRQQQQELNRRKA